jgi:hypothetical protein
LLTTRSYPSTHFTNLSFTTPTGTKTHSFELEKASSSEGRRDLTSLAVYIMRRQIGNCPQNGYRSYGFQDDGNSSDGPTYSSSSGGTSKDGGLTRPVIRPTLNPVSRVKTPEHPYTYPSRADSPMAPETPNGERSSFSLNGQQINETYKPRPSSTASPPKPLTPALSAFQSSPRQRAYPQHASNRPLTRNTRGHWALQQELKVKVLGVPKQHWTKDVYFAMSSYGNVTKVDMEPGTRDNNAWVIFQYVYAHSLSARC